MSAFPETEAVTFAVDEIISSEASYLRSLEAFEEKYIDRVRPIALGKEGMEALEHLSLTHMEFEQIFGHRLDSIIQHSRTLMQRLESVDICVSGPMIGGGRVGLVSECLEEAALDLHVYSPYVSSHPSSMHLLTKKKQAFKLSASSSKKKLFRRQPSAQELKKTSGHFLGIWEEVAAENDSLMGHNIESLLIMPVQRVPRYKMLLEQLLKKTDEEHPAYQLLSDTTDVYRTAATGINEALRQHEKIISRLGSDENIRPIGAETRHEPGSKFKITNTY